MLGVSFCRNGPIEDVFFRGVVSISKREGGTLQLRCTAGNEAGNINLQSCEQAEKAEESSWDHAGWEGGLGMHSEESDTYFTG